MKAVPIFRIDNMLDKSKEWAILVSKQVGRETQPNARPLEF